MLNTSAFINALVEAFLKRRMDYAFLADPTMADHLFLVVRRNQMAKAITLFALLLFSRIIFRFLPSCEPRDILLTVAKVVPELKCVAVPKLHFFRPFLFIACTKKL